MTLSKFNFTQKNFITKQFIDFSFCAVADGVLVRPCKSKNTTWYVLLQYKRWHWQYYQKHRKAIWGKWHSSGANYLLPFWTWNYVTGICFVNVSLQDNALLRNITTALEQIGNTIQVQGQLLVEKIKKSAD